MAYGLSEEDALKALTIDPAEIFGAGDELRSLRQGKAGDPVVFSGNRSPGLPGHRPSSSAGRCTRSSEAVSS